MSIKCFFVVAFGTKRTWWWTWCERGTRRKRTRGKVFSYAEHEGFETYMDLRDKRKGGACVVSLWCHFFFWSHFYQGHLKKCTIKLCSCEHEFTMKVWQVIEWGELEVLCPGQKELYAEWNEFWPPKKKRENIRLIFLLMMFWDTFGFLFPFW